METPIKEKELPIAELEKLGLYKDGALTLKDNDIAALLAGRRTDLHSLHNLEMDGFKINQLDAKLSLMRGEDGKVALAALRLQLCDRRKVTDIVPTEVRWDNCN